MKQKIPCLCGSSFFVEINEQVDLDNSPEILDQILNGTFLNFTCSNCGKKHKPEFPIIVIWASKKIRLEVLPELERGEFLRRKKDIPNTETIIGYPELADRLAVIRDGLEVMPVEVLKYHLLVRAEESYPELNISVWYHALVSDNSGNPEFIEFHLHGIKTDEVAVSRIPMRLYEKYRQDFKKKPKGELFVSLRHRTYLSVSNMIKPAGL